MLEGMEGWKSRRRRGEGEGLVCRGQRKGSMEVEWGRGGGGGGGMV